MKVISKTTVTVSLSKNETLLLLNLLATAEGDLPGRVNDDALQLCSRLWSALNSVYR